MPIFVSRLAGFAGGSSQAVTIALSANGVNLRTLFGNPTSTGNYIVRVNSGVTVGGLVTGTGWRAGQNIILINRGNIYGLGGAAGGPTGGGVAGGDALTLNANISIDNGSGNIFGGGGGGGGGATGDDTNGTGQQISGGSGGIGQGYNNPGGAGAGGAGTDGSPTPSTAGGPGGAWGQPGSAGAAGGYGDTGPGGAAGRAVRLNGYRVSWIAGNNSMQVKGVVQ